MAHMKQKHAKFDIKATDDTGAFEGYASVFDVIDSDLDVIEAGAFRETLAMRFGGDMRDKPKMLWQHDKTAIIGVWDEMREDARGLYVKGRILPEVEKGREALALMKAGALDSMSIGYKVTDSEYAENDRIRNIKGINLFEVSLVTWGSNDLARVTDVKALETVRDFEGFLRDAGFSKNSAKAISANGWNKQSRRDDDAEREALKALNNQIESMKGAFNGTGRHEGRNRGTGDPE